MSVQGHKNRLLTPDIIAKEALMLLKNNLVFAPLVYRGYDSYFGGTAKYGDTISIKKPFRTKTTSGRTLGIQPMVDQAIPLKIAYQENFGLEFTNNDMMLSIEQFSERYLKSGMIQMANKVDRTIALQLKKAFFSTGTAGVKPEVRTMLLAAAYATQVAVPDDGLRRIVMNPMDLAEMSDQIIKLNNPELVKTGIQKGYRGSLAGLDVFESANTPIHTVGNYTGSTPLINGANQTGDTLVTDGWAAGQQVLNAGDVIRIAGVYSINPQSYESTGVLQDFVVLEDVTADASGNASIKISPSINDGTLTTTDAEGNTLSLAAYQNVSNAPADNAAITVWGDSGKSYRQNYIFHKNAVALVVPEIPMPRGASVSKRATDPESGLSLLYTEDYNITDFISTARLDVIWGTDLIYPELAFRVWSVES